MNGTATQTDGKFLSRLFFKVLPAQIFLLIITGVNYLVDGLVGSNIIGADAVSTIGLYSPFQMIWLATGSILAVSSQVLCARYMGAGDLQKTRGVFSLNIILTVIITGVAALLSFTLSLPIARLLGASPVIEGDVAGFIIGRGIGLIPMVMGAQFVAFLSLEGQYKLNYIATGTMLAVNIALDLLFTAVLRKGVIGLGIATSLSQWFYMIITGLFFFSPRASLKFSFGTIDRREILQMLKIGFPSAMVFFLTSFRSSLFNNLLGKYDPTMTCVAAMSTVMLASVIFESFGMGVAATGRLLSSVSYGEKDSRSMTVIMKSLFTKGLLISLAASVVLFLSSGLLARLFYSDTASEVYLLTVRGLRFCSAVLLLETTAYIFSNYFQSIGRTVIVNVMSVIEGIAVVVPVGLLLIPKTGLDGVWAALLAGYAAVALCGPVYAIIYWKRLPKTLSEWVTIPKDFGAADDERFDASIHNLDDAVNAAHGIQDFCTEHGFDLKKAYYSALAVEEMCFVIINDRFDEGDRKHSIELHAVQKGGDIYMSIKDNCRPFNARERSELVNRQDDSPGSISMRVFFGIVKETEYQLTLGINVFTVTV